MNFQKVSQDQFLHDLHKCNMLYDREQAKFFYSIINLPKRSTQHSAGYDFVTPVDLQIKPGQSILVPTGIRALLDDDKVLMMFIRSSLGIKHKLVITNQTGIIDADYAYSENEGDIHIAITNYGQTTFKCEAGRRLCQGVIVKYFTVGDEVATVRNGGMGSTDE